MPTPFIIKSIHSNDLTTIVQIIILLRLSFPLFKGIRTNPTNIPNSPIWNISIWNIPCNVSDLMGIEEKLICHNFDARIKFLFTEGDKECCITLKESLIDFIFLIIFHKFGVILVCFLQFIKRSAVPLFLNFTFCSLIFFFSLRIA